MLDANSFIGDLLQLLKIQMIDNLSGNACIPYSDYWVGRLFDSEELYARISDLIEEYK